MCKKIVLILITICCFVATADAAGKNFTLVIDAGHGGGDAGAIGKAKVKEKDLTLRFALAFGALVEQKCPDVKVIYTRKTDKFVELYRRAEIANNAKADLFISVHINSVGRGTPRGFQTYTLGTSKRTGRKDGVMENLEVAKRENAVISLEKGYQQIYKGYDSDSPESNIIFEFVQDKNIENSVELAKYMQKYVCQATGRQDMGAQQDNLAVLRLTSMPACLLELGFISTPDEEAFMNSKRAEGMYARGMFNAFLAYRKRHGGNITIPYMPAPPAAPAPSVVEAQRPDSVEAQKPTTEQPMAEEVTSEKPIFKVQILTSDRQLKPTDKLLKGQTDTGFYKEGNIYKYTVGSSEDYNEIYRLRKQLLDKFPQAFVIAFKQGQKVDVQEAISEFRNQKSRK